MPAAFAAMAGNADLLLLLVVLQDRVRFVFGYRGHASPEVFSLDQLLPARCASYMWTQSQLVKITALSMVTRPAAARQQSSLMALGVQQRRAPLVQHSLTYHCRYSQLHDHVLAVVLHADEQSLHNACRFGPLDLLEDPSAPLLLEQQQHSLSWTSDAQAVLQQRAGDSVFTQAAEAALRAAQAVCILCTLRSHAMPGHVQSSLYITKLSFESNRGR
jgi:hypothetical protein